MTSLGPNVGVAEGGAVCVVAELKPGQRPELEVREDHTVDRWTDAPDTGGWTGQQVHSIQHQRLGAGWVHRFTVKGLDADRTYRYRWIDRASGTEIPGSRGRFRSVPVRLTEPLSVIVTSCNKEQSFKRPFYEHMWQHLAAHLDSDPSIRLLLHVGDQVYCDDAWDPVWEEYKNQALLLPRKKRRLWYDAQKSRWSRRYRHLYRRAWDSPVVQRVLRSVPNLMIWDDHDIHDGYGSRATDFWTYRPHLAAVAAQMFDEYQGSLNPEEPYRLGDSRGFSVPLLGGRLVVLDGRTHRDGRKNRRQLLGEHQWQALEQVLRTHDTTDGPLFMVSSTPLYDFVLSKGVHSKLIRKIATLTELADDLRDAWVSKANVRELERLLGELDALRQRGVPIVVISGDIHIHHHSYWWKGSDESQRIHQVTSSPLTNEPRGKLAVKVAYGSPPTDLPDRFHSDFSAKVKFFAHRRGYAQIKIVPDPEGLPRMSVNYFIEDRLGEPLEAQGWIDLS